MKTFLQRKILRTKENAELQKARIERLDAYIEEHYKQIKTLKKEQKRSENIAISLYSSIGYLVSRLSPKEKYTMFED